MQHINWWQYSHSPLISVIFLGLWSKCGDCNQSSTAVNILIFLFSIILQCCIFPLLLSPAPLITTNSKKKKNQIVRMRKILIHIQETKYVVLYICPWALRTKYHTFTALCTPPSSSTRGRTLFMVASAVKNRLLREANKGG